MFVAEQILRAAKITRDCAESENLEQENTATDSLQRATK